MRLKSIIITDAIKSFWTKIEPNDFVFDIIWGGR